MLLSRYNFHIYTAFAFYEGQLTDGSLLQLQTSPFRILFVFPALYALSRFHLSFFVHNVDIK